MQTVDVVVLGGGAAGLFCAAEAARRGRRTLLIEHREQVGKKILISGGGRCNFTNLGTTAANFLSANPHFCKSALARYRPTDFIALVTKYGIAYHEKTLGQLFCDNSARQIVDMLVREATAAGVQIVTDCRVDEVQKSQHFAVRTSRGEWTTSALVVATGGMAIPKMGATDFGLQLARQFNLSIEPAEPALVPLTYSATEREELTELSGVALPARVRCGRSHFAESLLFTHIGLSGPAILQASSYWQPGEKLAIDLFPSGDVAELLLMSKRAGSKEHIENALAAHVPKRLASKWAERAAVSGPLVQAKDDGVRRLAASLSQWQWTPGGTAGFDKAEVMRGGVSTHQLSSKTMESEKVKGLYFIGEVVDVTGWLGGYNFQWAWASGFAAGQAV